MDLVVYGMLLYLLLVISGVTCSDLEHESKIFQYLGCMGYSDLHIFEQEPFVTLSKGWYAGPCLQVLLPLLQVGGQVQEWSINFILTLNETICVDFKLLPKALYISYFFLGVGGKSLSLSHLCGCSLNWITESVWYFHFVEE